MAQATTRCSALRARPLPSTVALVARAVRSPSAMRLHGQAD